MDLLEQEATMKATQKGMTGKRRRKAIIRTGNSRITINVIERNHRHRRGKKVAETTRTVIAQEVWMAILDRLESITIGKVKSENPYVKSVTEAEATTTLGLGRKRDVQTQAVTKIEKGSGGGAAVAAQVVKETIFLKNSQIVSLRLQADIEHLFMTSHAR